jgi:DNA (cytosine-5)-methyltransferase 1
MEAGWFHPAPVWSDLATFDGRPWRGLVDILASGDPCQDNSVAGKRAGADGARFLAPEVIRIADECRPDRIFRENVPGNAGGQLEAIIPALERLGYRVACGIFSSAETGNTMQRERMFIMADRIRGSTLFNSASAWPSPVADAQDIAGRLRDRSQDGQEGGHTGGSGLEMAGAGSLGHQRARSARRRGIDLRMAVSMWKAPKATDGEKGGPNQRGSRGDLALPAMAAQWPGPQARDFKGVNQANPLDHNSRPLNEVAAHFLPPSSPAQPTADGSICSTDIPNTNQPSVKRKLNPIFVEALMRWPTGLSGFERQAMGSILWQQRMLTYLSMLCSRAEPAQPDLFGAAA